eukprot:2431503-Pyramimonas_sp.AAC.1
MASPTSVMESALSWAVSSRWFMVALGPWLKTSGHTNALFKRTGRVERIAAQCAKRAETRLQTLA